MSNGKPAQNDLYEQAIAAYGPAIDRLARSYEADSEERQDLLQEIHLALWRSFEGFDSRCSLRTWVYRVAHNVATSHVIRHRRTNSRTLLSLDALEGVQDKNDSEAAADRHEVVQQLLTLVQRLRPIDRQIMLLYLEGMDATSIGEITGVSPGNVFTKMHRIKSIIADRFWKGGRHER
ncbi:MAG: sigma-70 family RNA polymerase sigma factor [Acidobacteriota bacterium]|jgi:RNA polymerase sigma-70 factor (ECF subfamily)